MIPFILLAIMMWLDWKKAGDDDTEGAFILLRGFVVFIAIRMMGGSITAAVLLGIVWSIAGGVLFMMIGENRDSGNTTSSTAEKPKLPPGEYLLNGQGDITGKAFHTWDYPEYTVIESTPEGRILADASGKIICTRYVRQ